MQLKINELAGAAKTIRRVEPFRLVATDLSRLLAGYYFLFFLIVLPLLGLAERPDQAPETIAKSVLGGRATAATPKPEV